MFADLLVKSALYANYIAFEYRAGTKQSDGTTGIVGICYVVSTGTAPKGKKLERGLLAAEGEVNCPSSPRLQTKQQCPVAANGQEREGWF